MYGVGFLVLYFRIVLVPDQTKSLRKGVAGFGEGICPAVVKIGFKKGNY